MKKHEKLFWTFHKEPQKFCKYNIIKRFNFYLYKITQDNSLNVKLSNSQLNKLEPATENETEEVLRLSSRKIGDNEANLPHKLLSTNIIKFQIFVKLLQIIYQQILSYQKLSYLR